MKTDFNMAAAIRTQLEANPKLSLRETREAVQGAHPREKINVNSFGVAFSTQRRKLGIKAKGRKRTATTSAPQPAAAPRLVGRSPTGSNGMVPLSSLETAKQFITEAGGLEQARALLAFLQ